jgi:hypothetical protein
METPTRGTRLPTHVSDSLPKLVKSTQPLKCYWTYEPTHNLPNQNTPTRTAETCTACCVCCTGQTDGLRLLDRWHRSDRWTEPVRPVATAAAQKIVQESLSDFSRPWNKTTPKHKLHEGKPYTRPKKTTPNRPRTDQQHQDPKTHESSNSPEANPTGSLHR